MDDWAEWGFSIFFQLKKRSDKAIVEAKATGLGRMAEIIAMMNERPNIENVAIDMIPLSQLHYNSRGHMFPSVNENVLNILSLLIVILLVMGIVNFINFSTSQAPLRGQIALGTANPGVKPSGRLADKSLARRLYCR